MKEEIISFIEKELSYDATNLYECEKCGHAPKNYWIDHKESLASNLATKLGLKNIEQILDIIHEADSFTKGNKKEDAERIVTEIDDKIMGIPS